MAATGEGKDRRGDYQGTLADASSRKHPGLGWFSGGSRRLPRHLTEGQITKVQGAFTAVVRGELWVAETKTIAAA